MTGTMAANYMLNLALRALQLICAIVVMGTDGYGTEKKYNLRFE
jgi:hypothetical protein